MQQYQYDGPVMRFDDCVQHRWKATTVARRKRKRRAISPIDIKKKTA